MKPHALLLICTVFLFPACSRPDSPLHEQGDDPIELKQVVLLDTQGLWGGQDLWIDAQGNITLNVVRPPESGGVGGESGLQFKRYEFDLTEEQRAALLDLLKRHDYFSIKTKDRYGVPDEARPSIYVETSERSYAVAKWVGDEHRDFDPIYAFLLGIVESAEQFTPVSQGAYDWEWSPEGFPQNEEIWEQTRPKLEE